MNPSLAVRVSRNDRWQWGLAALALAAMGLLWVRSGFGSFELILLAGGIAVAVGAVAGQLSRNEPGRQTLPLGLAASTGAMWLGALGFGIEASGAAIAVLIVLACAIATPLAPQGLWLLVPACSITIPLLVLASFTETTGAPRHAEQAIAAAAATFALACAIDRFDPGSPERIPLALVFCAGAVALAGSAYTVDSLWLTVAISLVISGLVLDSLATRSAVRLVHVSPQLDLRWSFLGLLSITTGSAGISSVLVRGSEAAWTIFGSVSAGFAGLIALAVSVMRSERERTDHLLHIARESRVDGLTGLLNRRGIEERLTEELARAARYGHELSVLMIDLDDFKAINDRYGHAAGDQALRSIAVEIADSIRSIDVAGRYGGEEFLVLLPETDAAGALVVADRIRSAVEAGGQATVSLGAATRATEDVSAGELVERADGALYAAKRSGKNRTVLAD